MNNKVKKLKAFGIIAAVMILCFGMFTPTADAVKLKTDLQEYYQITPTPVSESKKTYKDFELKSGTSLGDIPFENVKLEVRTKKKKSCDIVYTDPNSNQKKQVTASYEDHPVIPVSKDYHAQCTTGGTRLSAFFGEKKVVEPQVEQPPAPAKDGCIP